MIFETNNGTRITLGDHRKLDDLGQRTVPMEHVVRVVKGTGTILLAVALSERFDDSGVARSVRGVATGYAACKKMIEIASNAEAIIGGGAQVVRTNYDNLLSAREQLHTARRLITGDAGIAEPIQE